VWLFAPISGSVWGDTFFGIPFQIAVIAVPVAAGISAALACWVIQSRAALRPKNVVLRGAAIGVGAFAIYSLIHTLSYTAFTLYRGTEMHWALAGGASFAGAMVLFGGISFMPLCCITAVACEWLGGKIAG
jgi:hypothetical protein